MNKKRQRVYVAAAAAMAILTATAEDLRTEVVVERTVEPQERAATRLSGVVPDMVTRSVTPTQLSYAEYSYASELTALIARLDPARYSSIPARSPYRGYAAIGYFPLLNIGATAGYRIIDNDKTTLGLHAQYSGSQYDGYADAGGTKPKVKNHSVGVTADFSHHFSAVSALGIGADFGYTALGNPLYGADYKQNVTRFDATAAWTSQVGRVGYGVNAGVGVMGFSKDMPLAAYGAGVSAPGVSETRISGGAGVAYLSAKGQPIAGVKLSADFVSSDDALPTYYGEASAAAVQRPTLGVISLTPYYKLKYQRFTASLGAKIDISTGGEGKKFHVAPDVVLGLDAASQCGVYVRLGGGEHLNTLRSLYDYTPYMPSAWVYGRSHVPVTIDAGINIGRFGGFGVELKGGYAVANDWLMPIMAFGEGVTPMFASVNLKGFHYGARLSYEHKRYFEAYASVEGAPQKYDRGYYLWRDRAKIVVSGGVTVHPIERLDIKVDYNYRGSRRIYSATPGEMSAGTPKTEELGSVSELSLGATYKINEKVTVYARGENILGHRYDIYPGLPSAGVHGLAGVSLKF